MHVIVAPAKDCDQSQKSKHAIEKDTVGYTIRIWILQVVNHIFEAKDRAQC